MTIPVIGFARSLREVRFWLYLQACPRCGERDLGEPKTSSSMIVGPDGKFPGGDFHVTCPRCGHQRSIVYYEDDRFSDYWMDPIGQLESFPDSRLRLGGPTPSRIIGAHELAAELARCLAGLQSEFSAMTKAELREQGKFHTAASTCAIELAKFIPDGAEEVPDSAFADEAGRSYKRAHPELMARAYLQATSEMLQQMGKPIHDRANAIWEAEQPSGDKRRLPIPAFSLASIKLHEQWVLHGDVGDNQQMIATGADAREANLSARMLASSILDKVTLDRADLSFASLDGAKLSDVYLRDANLADGSARGATFVRCHFMGSGLDIFKAPDATLEACDFTGARMIRSVWYGATLERCTFHGADLADALLSNATFIDCDLRDADLAITSDMFSGSTHETQFIRCDLRGANLAGRDLDRVRLIDCKLAATRGRPVVHGVVIERPDLSESGDGSRIGAASDVLEVWNRAAE